MREHLTEKIEELAPVAGELGRGRALGSLATILDGGASYARQLAVADATDGDLRAVVQHLIREFRTGPQSSIEGE